MAKAAKVALFAGVMVPGPAAFTQSAFAQSTTGSPTSAQVTVDNRIEKLGDLDFGEIIPGTAGGTVTLTLDGVVTTSGTVVAAGGNPQAAEFRITRRLLVDFPVYQGPQGTDTIELTHLSVPGQSMTLRDFTTDFNRTVLFGLPGYIFVTEYDFRVAGTLDVGPDQQPGTYLGVFTVNIDYN